MAVSQEAPRLQTIAAPAAERSAVNLPALEEMARRRQKQREQVLSIAGPIVLLGVWEGLSQAGAIDKRFFPAPSAVVGTFVRLLTSGVLILDTRDTLVRLVIGLCLGGIPGLLMGVAMGLSPNVRAFFKPIVAALFPIPKIAILPLLLLIFGLGETTKYVSVAVGVFFPMLINTLAGVIAIENIYFDVGKNFGASRWQFFKTVAIPGAMPGIITGLQLSLTVSLLLCITTEMVAAKSGLGYLIWNSWSTFSVEPMYAGLVVCALLGLTFQTLLDVTNRLVLPWRARK